MRRNTGAQRWVMRLFITSSSIGHIEIVKPPPPSSSSPPFLLFLFHSTPKTPSILCWGLLPALFVLRKFFPQACAQFWCSKQPFILSQWCCRNLFKGRFQEGFLHHWSCWTLLLNFSTPVPFYTSVHFLDVTLHATPWNQLTATSLTSLVCLFLPVTTVGATASEQVEGGGGGGGGGWGVPLSWLYQMCWSVQVRQWCDFSLAHTASVRLHLSGHRGTCCNKSNLLKPLNRPGIVLHFNAQ